MGSKNGHGCRNGFGFDFLEEYHKDGDEFLSNIVTGDKTWVPFLNFETKKQSKQWIHTHSLKKPKWFKQTPAR
jgi:hypothetical protein